MNLNRTALAALLLFLLPAFPAWAVGASILGC